MGDTGSFNSNKDERFIGSDSSSNSFDDIPEPPSEVLNNPQSPNDKSPLSQKTKCFMYIFLAGILIMVFLVIGVLIVISALRSACSAGNSTLTNTPSFMLKQEDTLAPLPTLTSIPFSTYTFTPQSSTTWTSTPVPIIIETFTLIPSQSLQPTFTFNATFAPTKIPTHVKAVCACSRDLYDCKDFNTHTLAQACYDYCVYMGWGDVHNLDKGGKGIVCKGLP